MEHVREVRPNARLHVASDAGHVVLTKGKKGSGMIKTKSSCKEVTVGAATLRIATEHAENDHYKTVRVTFQIGDGRMTVFLSASEALRFAQEMLVALESP